MDPHNLDNALAKAWMAYQDKIQEILRPLSDDDLSAYVAYLTDAMAASPSDITKEVYGERIEHIHVELGYRHAFRRGAEVLGAEGSSGVYCLAHDGDMKDCPPGSHD